MRILIVIVRELLVKKCSVVSMSQQIIFRPEVPVLDTKMRILVQFTDVVSLWGNVALQVLAWLFGSSRQVVCHDFFPGKWPGRPTLKWGCL